MSSTIIYGLDVFVCRCRVKLIRYKNLRNGNENFYKCVYTHPQYRLDGSICVYIVCIPHTIIPYTTIHRLFLCVNDTLTFYSFGMWFSGGIFYIKTFLINWVTVCETEMKIALVKYLGFGSQLIMKTGVQGLATFSLIRKYCFFS